MQCVVSLFASICHLLIMRLMFFDIFLCVFPCLVCLFSILCFCNVLCIVSPFVYSGLLPTFV